MILKYKYSYLKKGGSGSMTFYAVDHVRINDAWQQFQSADAAGRSARAASASAPEGEREAPAAASAAASAPASKAFKPAAEMPYVPKGYGPEDLAARTRAEYPGLGSGIDPEDEWVKRLGSPFGEEEAEFRLPGEEEEDGEKLDVPGVKDKKSPADVMNESKCETCAKRKYQDGSDDPGVSFKFATKVDPKAAQAKVRGHEMEHVVRERAKAKMEGRKVVSQSVTYHTGICPECGKFYIAGGTTRTVTAADNTKDFLKKQQEEASGNDDFDISA